MFRLADSMPKAVVARWLAEQDELWGGRAGQKNADECEMSPSQVERFSTEDTERVPPIVAILVGLARLVAHPAFNPPARVIAV